MVEFSEDYRLSFGVGDPDLLGKGQGRWLAADETFGVSRAGRVEDELAFSPHPPGLPVMDHGRSEQADSGMTVVVVVPGEKRGAEGAAVGHRPEAVRKLGAMEV